MVYWKSGMRWQVLCLYFYLFRMKTVADMEAVLMCGLLARRPNNVSVVLDSLDLAAVSGLRFQTRRTLIPASTQRGKTWTPFYSKREILKCAISKITCLVWKCLFHLSISFKLTFFVLKYIKSLYFLYFPLLHFGFLLNSLLSDGKT